MTSYDERFLAKMVHANHGAGGLQLHSSHSDEELLMSSAADAAVDGTNSTTRRHSSSNGRGPGHKHHHKEEDTEPDDHCRHVHHQQQHHHHFFQSPWYTSTMTPMTTRPYFAKPPSPQNRHGGGGGGGIRRVRSRSLGAEVEANRIDDFRNLLLPSLQYNNNNNKEQQQEQSALLLPSSSPLSGEKDSLSTTIIRYETTESNDDLLLIESPRQVLQQHPSRGESFCSCQSGTNAEINSSHEGVSLRDMEKKRGISCREEEENDNLDKGDDHDDNDEVKSFTSTTPANTPAWICVLYGLINATIVLPVLMSFGAIIYRDEKFAPYMPVLVKLTLVSGIVHQICFSTFSTLPFAVGQVQDAGLIFLSSMASFLVQYCKDYDDATLLATVTIGLSLCTALLGCGLILIGHLRLAQYVQMLPTCVVGGYLAFIGWFCGVSGVGIMAGSSEVTFKLVSQNIGLVLPGIFGGIFIYTSARKLGHMAVLPTCILLLLIIFYIVLYLTGSTIEEATEKGWIRKMDPPPPWYQTWDFLRFDKVLWSAFPQLLLTELSMIFVVALSSSLDVAAIELELGRPLNYNRELSMVGVSNLVSGLTGGYTGSYIFSQSIFSLRAGIRSRLAGYILAIAQIIVLALPFPILAFVPNFFFGSLLSMICVDLMYEWLWDVRTRVTRIEYFICLSTFGLIQFLGVEYGILAGVAIYLLCKKLFGIDVAEDKFADYSTHDDNEGYGCTTEREDHVKYGSI